MSKFRTNKAVPRTPVSDKHKADNAALQAFAKGASLNIENLNPDDVATQSFTVPINEYHLNILKLLKEKEKRSQRKIAERLLAKAIREEWDSDSLEPKQN